MKLTFLLGVVGFAYLCSAHSQSDNLSRLEDSLINEDDDSPHRLMAPEDESVDDSSNKISDVKQFTGIKQTMPSYIETEKKLIYVWTSITLSLAAFIAVAVTVNMPLTKDPLLYTKIYTGSHQHQA